VCPEMHVRFMTIDGLRIRYADNDGAAERVILLTSPWPESVYAFAPIWPLLTPRFRLVAVDLPGFGAARRPPLP
jgi:pimeloyl-ACP methyl ester carboxylesterase